MCSRFADYIIVADQQSRDGSREICRQFRKVILIENWNPDFNEDERQILLINEARRLVPGPRILLALDADEVLSGDSLDSPDWARIRASRKGTVLKFEKPDLYWGTGQCIRYEHHWPLGYVDDGADLETKRIHSIRIPRPHGAGMLDLHEIKFIHYAMARPRMMDAKMRFYCVQETLMKTTSWRRRMITYAPLYGGWTGRFRDMVAEAPREWFEPWEKEGIDMANCDEDEFCWFDFEVLNLIARFGARKFWWCDIWSFDWEKCLERGRESGYLNGIQSGIRRPPVWVDFLRNSLIRLVKLLEKGRKKVE